MYINVYDKTPCTFSVIVCSKTCFGLWNISIFFQRYVSINLVLVAVAVDQCLSAGRVKFSIGFKTFTLLPFHSTGPGN